MKRLEIDQNKTQFYETQFFEAQFYEAQFYEAQFYEVQFYEAQFYEAQFYETHFYESQLCSERAQNYLYRIVLNMHTKRFVSHCTHYAHNTLNVLILKREKRRNVKVITMTTIVPIAWSKS